MATRTSGKSRRQTAKPPERSQIGVSTLKGFNLLFPDDLYELAYWLLNLSTAKDHGTNSRSRHTVYGLTAIYAQHSNLDRDTLVSVLESRGLNMGATIEFDEDVA